MKKLTVMLLIAAMVLGVSACGNSANKENTATESQMSTQKADLDARINELTQKENSILENHKAYGRRYLTALTNQLSRMRQLRITEIFWQTL